MNCKVSVFFRHNSVIARAIFANTPNFILKFYRGAEFGFNDTTHKYMANVNTVMAETIA